MLLYTPTHFPLTQAVVGAVLHGVGSDRWFALLDAAYWLHSSECEPDDAANVQFAHELDAEINNGGGAEHLQVLAYDRDPAAFSEALTCHNRGGFIRLQDGWHDREHVQVEDVPELVGVALIEAATGELAWCGNIEVDLHSALTHHLRDYVRYHGAAGNPDAGGTADRLDYTALLLTREQLDALEAAIDDSAAELMTVDILVRESPRIDVTNAWCWEMLA